MHQLQNPAVATLYGPAPDFVLQRDTEVVGEGYNLLRKLVEVTQPSFGCNPIIFPASSGLRSFQGIPNYRRDPWSGKPFHIHSGALNMVLAGMTRGYWVTAHSGVHWRKQGQALEGFRSAPETRLSR